MARPRLPSDSHWRAEMRCHGLIQRGQALSRKVSFLFSAINWCESSGSRRTDARQMVGGVPQYRELVMNFGEEGGWVLARGLIAPREKTLLLRDGSSAETIRVRAHWQPLSWCGWAPHLLWVWRYVKKMMIRVRGQSQSPITPPCLKPFSHRSLEGRKREGWVSLWKESYLRAQRGKTETLTVCAFSPAESVWDFPKRDTHSGWVSSACSGFPHVLQWRRVICNFKLMRISWHVVTKLRIVSRRSKVDY